MDLMWSVSGSVRPFYLLRVEIRTEGRYTGLLRSEVSEMRTKCDLNWDPRYDLTMEELMQCMCN